MRLIKLFSIFILSVFIFSSCDPNGLSDGSKNWWESNSLVRLHLKGKVKSVTKNNGELVTTFNKDGFITEDSYIGSTSTSVTTNTYNANGQLEKIKTVYTSDFSPTTTTEVTYEYASHGKYIALFPMHLWEMGLIPNLKAMINEWGRTDYVFEGDNLLIISTNSTTSLKDTNVIEYDGKYPASFLTEFAFGEDMTYASNGMFKTYTEGFYGAEYRDTRIYKFKTDSEYQLLESEEYNYTTNSGTVKSTVTHTYNDKKDLLISEAENYTEEYYNYVYDSNGNWTKRSLRTKNQGGDWVNSPDEERVIEYWP